MNKVISVIDFTLTYNLYKKPLYNYVWKMVSDKSITDDIVQNVFMKFYQNLNVIKQTGNPSAWLFTTARNEVYGYLRKKKIRSEDLIDDNFDYASIENLKDDIEETEIKDLIEQEVNKMNDETKEIFLLRHYSELSYKEIAAVLGLDESIVKGRLFRARQTLIDKISKLVR